MLGKLWKNKNEVSILVLMGILSSKRNKGLVGKIMHVHLLCYFCY